MRIVEIHEKGAAAFSDPRGDAERLDRSKWHQPLVSIIITHFNYSPHLKDALLSVLDQTYENWECVVVDDCSSPDHRASAEAIVKALRTEKIRFVGLDKNIGQILAFYAGLDQTSGEFVCVLDPDDRYAQAFLAESLSAHLNPVVYCPAVCSEQILMHNGAVTTGIYSPFNRRFIKDGEIPAEVPSRLTYFPPEADRWQWTSTSSFMFRRPALQLMRPRRALSHPHSVDAYLAPGAHLLGGALFLNRPLVYRQLHKGNDWMAEEVFAIDQKKCRPEWLGKRIPLRADVIDAIKANGGERHLIRHETKRSPLRRWKHSIAKRWRRLAGWDAAVSAPRDLPMAAASSGGE